MTKQSSKEKRKALKGVSSKEISSEVHMEDTLDKIVEQMKKNEKGQ